MHSCFPSGHTYKPIDFENFGVGRSTTLFFHPILFWSTTKQTLRVLVGGHVPTKACHIDALGNWLCSFILSVLFSSCETVLINSKVLFLYSESGLIFFYNSINLAYHVGALLSPEMENLVLENLRPEEGN